jgi:hypothetical protein
MRERAASRARRSDRALLRARPGRRRHPRRQRLRSTLVDWFAWANRVVNHTYERPERPHLREPCIWLMPIPAIGAPFGMVRRTPRNRPESTGIRLGALGSGKAPVCRQEAACNAESGSFCHAEGRGFESHQPLSEGPVRTGPSPLERCHSRPPCPRLCPSRTPPVCRLSKRRRSGFRDRWARPLRR